MSQADLFEPTIAQRFDQWRQTRGGAFCLCKLYAVTARYVRDWRRTGIKPGTRLVWEVLRYELDDVRRKLQARGHELRRERGFWLNDHFTAHAIRHMIQHRPEWNGIFELRELDVSRGKRKVRVVVIEEKEAA